MIPEHLKGRKSKKVIRNFFGYKRREGYFYCLDMKLNVIEIPKNGDKYF
jgi:hypothetical protein